MTDFSKIIIEGIDGNPISADFQKQLGNQLYMQGTDIEECELGRKIYFAEGAVELSEKERLIIRKHIHGYSYVAREAIVKAMENT